MKQRLFLLKLILLIAAPFLSCKKFVEVPIPKNQLVNSQVFADSAGANAAVVGIYINMMQYQVLTPATAGVTITGGAASDELDVTTILPDQNQYFNNAVSSKNPTNADLWLYGYKFIYTTNACIDGIAASHTVSPSLKQRLTGECKLTRAFLYFNLVNLFGDLPLVEGTDYRTNKHLQRTPVAEVYNFILTDLNEAKAALPVAYITTGRQRPNKFAAAALLSKVHLYNKNWSKAESEATEIISSQIYSLPALKNVFLANSQEVIWSLESILPFIETYEGASFVSTSTSRRPNYILTNYLLNTFEANDQRRVVGNWINSITVAGVNYYFPFKYKQWFRVNANTPTENYIVFRLAEQYLIRAEARAQQNNLTGAIEDLNIIRTRAGLNPLPNSLSQAQVLAAVEQERRVELFAEWGNRWFDLKRWNKADATLAPIKGSNWEATDVLFPVPEIEISNNPALTQNKGY
jgi:hypothetical protein